MVKVTIIGASGTVGKNVAFQLAKENVIDEVILLSRQKSHQKVCGEVTDM